MLTNKYYFLNFFSMLNSFTQYRSYRALAWGQLAIFFLQWWGRVRCPVGQMPHQSMVLKNALVITTVTVLKK
jgi:hypothetical protein